MLTPGPSFRFVLFVNGILLDILAVAMLVPAAVDLVLGNDDWRVFALSAAATGFCGGLLAAGCRPKVPALHRREGFLLTVCAWLLVTLFAALPLMIGSPHLSPADAVFEAMSGLTTTGATILTGLDTMPPGILLWRSLTQWLGGIGIVAMAIIMLPLLRIGGMQLFRSESSDIAEKAVPRAYQVAGVTATVYLVLTLLCAGFLSLAGMPAFDAVNHAMATIATGGFSTKDASVGFYDSLPIEVVLIVFMTASALPLVFYARLVLRWRRSLLTEPQIPGFLALLALAIVLCTAWNVATNGMEIGTALRLSAFNVTSVLTDTGFATTDFSAWGSFAVGLFFVLYFIGGCAGSTAGAIKIFRWQIMSAVARHQMRRMLSPNRVLIVRYGGQVLDDDAVSSVLNVFFLYLLTFAVLSLALMATGLDFLSSTSGVAQAMANAGPGLGPIVGPAANFSSVSDTAKWILSFAMLLGRLELTTVYVLFLGDFWKQ